MRRATLSTGQVNAFHSVHSFRNNYPVSHSPVQFSAGIKRLVRHKQPRVLSRLAELDLSRNKNICNDAIRSLHKALLRLEKSKVEVG